MALSLPDNSPIAGSEKATGSWLQWFTRVNAFVNAGQQSGPTADRPTTLLWIGRTYYDTTLGYPVYVHSVGPVVWHNGAGAVV
jgi:hypothetical protein